MNALYNKTIEAFNKFAEQYADFTFSNLLQYELNRFIALIPKNAKILDIGCGCGRDVQYFLDYELQPIGVDASSELIKEAKKRVPDGDFKQMDMLNLTLEQSSFDGIWALDSISYLNKSLIPQILSSFNKLLKQDAILFISVRQGEGEKLISHEKVGKEQILIAFFSQNEIEELIKQADFEILNSYVEDGEHFTWLNIFAKKK